MAGGVVGVLLTVPVAVIDDVAGPASPLLPIEVDPAAAAAFVGAWERSRTTTWQVESTFSRELVSGRSLHAEVLTVQRPPDRLEVGLGSVEGRRRGGRFACSADPDGELRCREVEAGLSYAEEVARDLRRLEVLVTERGRRVALYAVEESDGCFDLRLRFSYPAPPYGQSATFCFDVETGAPVRTVIRRADAVDTTVAREVSGQVDDADLRPPRSVEVPVVS
jgi:hypothetical protein